MELEEKQKAELAALLAELITYKGRHTELISVYAPAGSSLAATTSQLEAEKATAQNIKSKSTRKNVLDALEKLIRELKLYKQLPANGLALFCGNVSKVEGRPDIKLWAIEPPLPLKVKLYRCDQQFVLEPLQNMIEEKVRYGLIVLDAREATLGLLEGKTIKVLKHLTSGVPGKIRAGGQSAARFERLREEAKKEFFRRVADYAKKVFYGMELEGLLLGGPGPTKEDWLKEGQLITALQQKILAVRDVGYVDEHGLHLLVKACEDVLAEKAVIKEKKLLEKFFQTLARKPELAVYGKAKVEQALEAGAVEVLLISTELERQTALELEAKAKALGAETHYISTETDEGKQFKSLAVGALLRFALSLS